MHLKPALSFVFDKSRNNYKVLPSLFSGIQMTRVVDVDGERQNTSLPSPSSLVCCLGLQYSRVFLCFMQMGSIPRVVL